MYSKRILAFAVALALLPSQGMAARRFGWITNGGDCKLPRQAYDRRDSSVKPACCPARPDGAKPNVILFVSDDQGSCHYGHAGSCRSAQTGADIPAPLTPNLDLLAAYGTVFPIAHNSSSWCFPSLNTILTGRYQKDIEPRSPGDFDTIAKVVGDKGYCSLKAGKLSGIGVKQTKFSAETTAEDSLGRVACAEAQPAAGPGITPGSVSPPGCGALASAPDNTAKELEGVFEFIDAMVYDPEESATLRVQPFFVWYAPRLPHKPLTAARKKKSDSPIVKYLFKDEPCGTDCGRCKGLGDPDACCAGNMKCGKQRWRPYARLFNKWASSDKERSALAEYFTEERNGTVYNMYGNVWWADDSVRAIWRFLKSLSEPHCRKDGSANIPTPNPNCDDEGTLARVDGLWDNTVMIHLSDNGFHLPHAKHNFTENGYRTRIIVFDPKNGPPCDAQSRCEVGSSCTGTPATCVPNGEHVEGTILEPDPDKAPFRRRVRPKWELAHAVDILPTIRAFVSGQPQQQVSSEAWKDPGKDLTPYLNGSASPSDPLRKALCGHRTPKPGSATNDRYLLTRPGSVGRCIDGTLPEPRVVLPGDWADCSGADCELPTCTSDAKCTAPKGGLCLAGRCYPNPPCIDEATCQGIGPDGADLMCGRKDARWCQVDREEEQAPTKLMQVNRECRPCTEDDQCADLGTRYACSPEGYCTHPRECPSCAPAALKMYVGSGKPNGDPKHALVDLFLEPDEVADGPLTNLAGAPIAEAMTASVAYQSTRELFSCLIDDFHKEGEATLCNQNVPAAVADNFRCSPP